MHPVKFVAVPHSIARVRAKEAELDRIYAAAHAGLKGDSLALAAGMNPQQFRQLSQLDPDVDMAVKKGKADSELEHATLLATASRNGDAKASLAILQHQHGWQSKEAAAAQFGSGGINIIIEAVPKPDFAQKVARVIEHE
jgi:hypothetical protein